MAVLPVQRGDKFLRVIPGDGRRVIGFGNTRRHAGQAVIGIGAVAVIGIFAHDFLPVALGDFVLSEEKGFGNGLLMCGFFTGIGICRG